MIGNEQGASSGGRFAAFLDRAEELYLKILRGAVLLIATLLVIYAAGLAAFSLYRVARSPDSVKVEEVSVTPQELVGAELVPARGAAEAKPVVNTARVKAYEQFVAKYYRLFQTKFEPFRQPDDKQLSLGEFDDNFVNSKDRIAAANAGQLDSDADLADLNKLHDAMAAAVALPEAQKRLKGYKSARKTNVCRNVEKTRTEYVAGWDSYSTACSNWYEYPMGCAVSRPVERTYTTKECAMEFPKGTQSHMQIFRAFQDKFTSLLEQRRAEAAAEADAERQSIMAGNMQGKADLFTALAICGVFIVLMFFFLLIAIERHQRRSREERVAASAQAGNRG